MKTNAMVNIETLGTSSNAAILSIGAVKFNESGITSEFSQNVQLQSCLEAGLAVDEGSFYFWMEQDPVVQAALLTDLQPIATVLQDFNNWLGVESEVIMWGNTATFDNVILANAYKATGVKLRV